MFLTVLKEQPFGSDHFLVLFSMKSIKKRKKKSALKGVRLILSAWGERWPRVELNCSFVGLKMKKTTKKHPFLQRKVA